MGENSEDSPIPPSAGVPCGHCGTLNDPPAGRCACCGTFLPANQEAVTTGIYRRQQPTEIRAEAESLVAGIVADKGGEAELSTLERAYVANLADLVVMMRLLVNDAGARGLFTASGNPRRTFDAYLSGLDRFDRLSQRIGTKRQARQLRSNMEAFIDRR